MNYDDKQSDFYTHSEVASHLESNTQFQKYHNTRTGHGYAAEDANALNDLLRVNTVDKTGLNNDLDGPDRIVNGVPIQTKYWNTAYKTVNSAFDNTNGYRYPGQQLEVPFDQYDECVKLMKDKISSGLVKDANGNTITDINKADELVKKGSITYDQAKNIAKSGNIDSLTFDAKNNVISSSYIGGISFLISFARYKWNGTDTKESIKLALIDGFQSGGVAMLVGVASSQLLRYKSAAAMTVLVRCGVKPLYGTTLGKSAIEAIAKASLGKAVYGAAAVNYVSKLMRSNLVTSAISTVVMTAPDFYRATISKNISWAQFSKNIVVNVAGVAGGVGGWAAGAAAGAAVGSFIPLIGTAVGGIAGGILGALGGGIGASQITKSGLDQFIKDDAQEMLELLEPVTENICVQYMLSEDEVGLLVEHIKKKVDVDWLRDMYGYGDTHYERKRFAHKEFSEVCDGIVCRRERISLPSNEMYHAEVNTFINEVANAVE